jgi:hypothetical protein
MIVNSARKSRAVLSRKNRSENCATHWFDMKFVGFVGCLWDSTALLEFDICLGLLRRRPIALLSESFASSRVGDGVSSFESCSDGWWFFSSARIGYEIGDIDPHPLAVAPR